MGGDEIFSKFFMSRIGNHIVWLEEVDSTNLYAERLLQGAGAEEGTVVAADFQTEGKGQGDNNWESERGKNLMVTVILKPFFLDASDQFILNKAMTLAVCDLVRSTGISPSVKWPNDIYADDKKIAGLLISHRVTGSVLEHTVVGIGVNLNQETFSDSLPNPVSVKGLTGTGYHPKDALNDMVGLIDIRYDQVRRGMAARIGKEYLEYLRGLGQWLMYKTPSGNREGRIRGVDEFGRLVLEFRDGRTELFSHGEILNSEF
jgi:BirA family biotin operon repressor/biotin-[acetyl-CoA-carboxylase] ligase